MLGEMDLGQDLRGASSIGSSANSSDLDRRTSLPAYKSRRPLTQLHLGALPAVEITAFNKIQRPTFIATDSRVARKYSI